MLGFAVSSVAESTVSKSDVFRVTWALPLLIAPITLVGMYFMPPSPRWLLLRAERASGHSLEPLGAQHPLRTEAFASLTAFRRGLPAEIVEAELIAIEATLKGGVAEVPGLPSPSPSPSHDRPREPCLT